MKAIANLTEAKTSLLTIQAEKKETDEKIISAGFAGIAADPALVQAKESSFAPEPPAANVQAGQTLLFRLYNPNTCEHFYATSQRELAHLAQAGWDCEEGGWRAPAHGEPVYRLYNPNAKKGCFSHGV